jgi:hypothetical protein
MANVEPHDRELEVALLPQCDQAGKVRLSMRVGRLSDFSLNRRSFLRVSAGGLGSLALAHLLGSNPRAAEAFSDSPLAPKAPHHKPRAKSVICLFQHGGPSQMDLFDPKPELNKRDGQDHPGQLEIHFDKQAGKLLKSPFEFRPAGKSGIVLSELLPHTSGIADEITLIRSMKTDSVDHESALRIIHSGKFQAGRPTWGSWVIYGLGTERQDLPAYVVLSDPGGLPVDGIRNWTSGWLPAVYQGTQIRSEGTPGVQSRTARGRSRSGAREPTPFSRRVEPLASRRAFGQLRTCGAHSEF